MNQPQLIGVDEAADRLGVSRSTMRHWIQIGEAPPSARIGRRRYFKAEQIDAWVQRHFEGQTVR